jgi:hypothetical protein
MKTPAQCKWEDRVQRRKQEDEIYSDIWVTGKENADTKR